MEASAAVSSRVSLSCKLRNSDRLVLHYRVRHCSIFLIHRQPEQSRTLECKIGSQLIKVSAALHSNRV